jgi:fucose permease
LLFFQFGNEGVFAGWLALFLIQKLGASPVSSLLLLSMFWFALLVGRILGQWLLNRVRHGRLLAGATFSPMFACLILSLTDNMFGAISGVLLAAGGFAIILPLVAERIGSRFPYFHPGFFNGIFSFALSGALLAPATIGYFAHFYGIEVVMGLPLLGSIAVFVLQLLIVLESKISGRRLPSTAGTAVTS